MQRVEAKVCIVTRGAPGIGQACVRRLAQEDGRIAIFDRPVAGGEALAGDLQSHGVQAD